MPKKLKNGSKKSKVWRDPDDAPVLTKEYFKKADVWDGDKLIRRGRPSGPVPKRPVTIRLDIDVIAHFQKAGPGWQTRINAVLRRAANIKGA
jgi:uncharacterized protein (DUF4415 family)